MPGCLTPELSPTASISTELLTPPGFLSSQPYRLLLGEVGWRREVGARGGGGGVNGTVPVRDLVLEAPPPGPSLGSLASRPLGLAGEQGSGELGPPGGSGKGRDQAAGGTQVHFILCSASWILPVPLDPPGDLGFSCI